MAIAAAASAMAKLPPLNLSTTDTGANISAPSVSGSAYFSDAGFWDDRAQRMPRVDNRWLIVGGFAAAAGMLVILTKRGK